MTSHLPAVNVTPSERLPRNMPPLTLTAACFVFCSRKPFVVLRSSTATLYRPAFRLFTLLPLWARVSLPAALTAAVSVPRNGRIAEPTMSCDVAFAPELDELEEEVEADDCDPTTSVDALNEKTVASFRSLCQV